MTMLCTRSLLIGLMSVILCSTGDALAGEYDNFPEIDISVPPSLCLVDLVTGETVEEGNCIPPSANNHSKGDTTIRDSRAIAKPVSGQPHDSIILSVYEGLSLGSEVNIDTLCIDHHGDSPEEATDIPTIGRLAGALQSEGDVDWLKIAVPADGTLTLTTISNTAIELSIQDQDHQEVSWAVSCSSVNKMATAEYLMAGVYYVRVSEVVHTTGNVYSMNTRFRPDDGANSLGHDVLAGAVPDQTDLDLDDWRTKFWVGQSYDRGDLIHTGLWLEPVPVPALTPRHDNPFRPPSVSSVGPDPLTFARRWDSPIWVYFDMPHEDTIDLSTVTAETFVVRSFPNGCGETPVPGSYSLINNGRGIKFVPDGRYPTGVGDTTVIFTLVGTDTGSGAIKSTLGRTLDGDDDGNSGGDFSYMFWILG
jgi:hypothetical protein